MLVTPAGAASFRLCLLGFFLSSMFDQKVINCLAQKDCLRNTALLGQRIKRIRLFWLQIDRLHPHIARGHNLTLHDMSRGVKLCRIVRRGKIEWLTNAKRPTPRVIKKTVFRNKPFHASYSASIHRDIMPPSDS